MILYPYCNLNLLWGVDIVRHFHWEYHESAPLREQNSSMVLFLPPSQPRLPQQGQFTDRGDRDVIRHLSCVHPSIELPANISYSGRHCYKPDTEGVCTLLPCFMKRSAARPYLHWEKKQLKKLEKENPSQSLTVIMRNINITSAGHFRYNYGQVDLRHVPLLRSSKLLVVDGAGGSVLNMSNNDFHLKPTSNEIPLASNFGQVFLAVLFGLPMKCKLALLKNRANEEGTTTVETSFTTPNGISLSRAELVMICAASEIAHDIFSCTRIAERMIEFARAFENNSAEYVENGATILRGMELLTEEGKERKKRIKNNHVNRAFRQILQLKAAVKRMLKRAGVNGRNLLPMVSLNILMNTDAIHKTSQHRICDGRWNIPG